MKVAIVLFAAIATAHCGVRPIRQGRQGWPAPTPTPGWSTPAPSGWPSPSPAGWTPVAIDTNIDLSGALAAAGSGWAAENHQDNVVVIGAGGWGPNAELTISSNGQSVVAQEGSILQVTSQDSENAASLNNVSVGQIAEAQEGQVLDASGIEVSNQQSGWAAASGEGASAADAESILTVNAANLGMAKP